MFFAQKLATTSSSLQLCPEIIYNILIVPELSNEVSIHRASPALALHWLAIHRARKKDYSCSMLHYFRYVHNNEI